MAEKTPEIATREGQGQQGQGQRLARREPQPSPFTMLDRFASEIESVFDDFGLGRSWLAPRWGRSGFRTSGRTGLEAWAPEIEVYQQNNELVVHADLPGLKKEDVHVDVTDNEITISGERRQERETERGGIYQSERSYGAFCRTIPVPEGAITDQAKATFKDGVLEVRLPAPPDQVTRGRRLEIKGFEEKK